MTLKPHAWVASLLQVCPLLSRDMASTAGSGLKHVKCNDAAPSSRRLGFVRDFGSSQASCADPADSKRRIVQSQRTEIAELLKRVGERRPRQSAVRLRNSGVLVGVRMTFG